MNLRTPLFPQTISSAKAISVPVCEISRAAQQWVFEGSIRQLSPRTIDSRKALLTRFVWFHKREELPEATTATIKQFLAYVATAHTTPEGRWDSRHTSRNRTADKPVTAITIATYHNILRAFFAWLVVEEVIPISPMLPVAPPICRPDQIQPLTDDEIHRILEATRQSRNPLRDYAICMMLLDTGMRASELVSLKYRDIDMLGKRASVTGKGNKRRLISWGATCSKALWKHLKSDELRDDDFVFRAGCGRNVHGGLSRDALNRIIGRLCEAADVHRAKHGPHAFRHTFAVDFLRQGGNIFTLKERLGHTSLAMTNKYVAFAQADIERQAMQFSPADRLSGSKR